MFTNAMLSGFELYSHWVPLIIPFIVSDVRLRPEICLFQSQTNT